MEKKILVTGIGGNVGQGILRNIKDSFPEIMLIGVDINSFTAGNYLCNKTFQVPYSYEQNYISAIQGIVDSEHIDLIIPSTDYEVYYLSLNKPVLNATVLASDAEIAKIYLDKYETFLYHTKNDIPFAQSWKPKEFDHSVDQIIAKPREGRGSRGILINPSNPEVLSEEYMIQALLKGKEITSAVYVTKENVLHSVFTMERELTNGTTSKSKVIFEYDDEIRVIAQKMIDLGGLKGSFNIQSIVTENREIVPFEVNCRISGTNSIRHNLGFQDVKYGVQEYLYNVKPDVAKPIKGIATRIFLDVVYPDASHENELNNLSSKHILY
ncbi:ATP-grasp domain-containing protein [Flavobacterium sharifuzzamanii]|uniref:ATP-grasp domain-containing protein n=1 Tax=Flavobacterium sharifuzzamanii TaxID=2211133 RepID=UPI000DAB3B88|nr:ATP-grasp domain-containing protein [Flavobacterium sharifuzzamanii]KAF2081146.1 ATP-grasp domain-containing protein [Flavobacterium sharifuzzamanii]